MSTYRGTYYPAKACTGGPTDGARALMAWFLGAYTYMGARNLGIYNCRPIAGTSTLSVHAEGRAADLGAPQAQWMAGVAQLLHDVSAELGIQLIIYNRRVWACNAPDAWRPYLGTNPHTDHAHIELTPRGAIELNVARVNAAIQSHRILPVLRRGATGDLVKRLQTELNAALLGPALVVDGIFGPATEHRVQAYQTNHRLSVDGVVGPHTWFALLTD